MDPHLHTLRVLLALGLAFAGAASATAEPTVTGLGTLGTSPAPFRPWGFSGNGKVVVGAVNAPATAVRWEAGVMTALVAPFAWQYANVVSADGGVVAGQSWRWDHGTVTRIYDPSGGIVFSSTDASPDGSVLVGYWSGGRVFRWQAGVSEELVPPPGHDTFSTTILSGDGSTIASNGRVSGAGGRAVIGVWRDGGATVLPGITPTSSSNAFGITADGGTIVGESSLPGVGGHAVIWIDGVPELLPDLAGLPSSIDSNARDVSADASVIVGFFKDPGSTYGQATIWYEGEAHRLFELIIDLGGTSALGWILDEVYFVSDDGNTIVGSGTNPSGAQEAWIAHFDTCKNGRDDDGDGQADFPADPGCAGATAATEAPQCQDGIDNDGDGSIDFDGGAAANGGLALGPPDGNCTTASGNRERAAACGLGAEIAAAMVALAIQTRRRLR